MTRSGRGWFLHIGYYQAMTIDSPEAERWAAVKDRSRIFPSSHPLRRLFVQHPALILTGGYFFLTAIGFTYTSLLFLNFKINIIYYAEISDFLLSALRDPLVILASIAPLPLFAVYMRLAFKLRQRFPRYDAFSQKSEAMYSSRTLIWIPSIVVLLWAIAFTAHYANYVAGKIRAGQRKSIEARFTEAGIQVTTPAVLLGTTSRFVFLHEPQRGVTHIIPNDKIAELVVQGKKKKVAPAAVLPAQKR